MTLEKIYRTMMREFRSVHTRIDGIQVDVAELKKDVAELKKDVAELKKDVAELKTDVAELKTDVATLQKDVSGLHDYNETESKIKEQLDAHFVMKLLDHQQNGFVTKMSVKEVYNLRGSPISELDGALFVHSLPPPYSFPLPPIHSVSYLFIESKHSVSKGKIDQKLLQMVYIHMYLQNAVRLAAEEKDAEDEKVVEEKDDDASLSRRLTKKEKRERNRLHKEHIKSSVHPNFQHMIDQWLIDTSLPIEHLVQPIHLIFASNRLTADLTEYIAAIYRGIDSEEEYDDITRKLFYSNVYIVPILKVISNDVRLPKPFKRSLYSLSMSEIRTHFSEGGMLASYTDETIREHLLHYHDLIDGFVMMKGRVGYVEYNNVYYPPLFPIRSLNQHAGAGATERT